MAKETFLIIQDIAMLSFYARLPPNCHGMLNLTCIHCQGAHQPLFDLLYMRKCLLSQEQLLHYLTEYIVLRSLQWIALIW